jgi:hypothetical protein
MFMHGALPYDPDDSEILSTGCIIAFDKVVQVVVLLCLH